VNLEILHLSIDDTLRGCLFRDEHYTKNWKRQQELPNYRHGHHNNIYIKPVLKEKKSFQKFLRKIEGAEKEIKRIKNGVFEI
jgi:hypothetical protein